MSAAPQYRDPEKEYKEDYDTRAESLDHTGERRRSHYDAELVAKDAVVLEGTFDPVYEAKARVLNRAIQEIGMGRYQWQLFVVIGFGWAADNAWPIVTRQVSRVAVSMVL